MGQAVRGLAGKHSAVVLANHGPVVAGKELEAAVYAIEELEETARLSLLLRGSQAVELTEAQIADVISTFEVDWE
jgi:ribulose-5-phosphate 4-epimerase/fuculose-1-phosphate aldolase